MASTTEDPQNSSPSATPEAQVDCQPTGKNAELLDSDDDEPVAEEPAPEAAPPPTQQINIQQQSRHFPIVMEFTWNTKREGAM